MAKEPVGKLIKLSEATWNALAADAERCKRSSTKQLEAILTTYYGLDNVELEDVAEVRETVSPYLAKSDQPASGKDPRKGRAFLERVLREMDEEEGTEDTKGGDRKTGNG
jgi:hypothetical protein